MVKHYLEFEKPLVELEREIENLKRFSKGNPLYFSEQLKSLEEKLHRLQKEIFSNLTGWQITQLARHIDRPKASHYVQWMCEDFVELHGDRNYGDDPAILGGMARFNGRSVTIIAHQKGADAKEMAYRNFGMPHPEGYRKALRLMKLAELFKKPVLTMIDTPGAFPGVGAEERGQGEAIARNLKMMIMLRTPIITVVIGEGGSGGALAIGVGDRILMLEHSIYSVISPEGCAAILWKDGEKGKEVAAESLKLTAADLSRLGVIDEIVKEPLGGAHRDPEGMAQILKEVVERHLKELEKMSEEELLSLRYEKFRRMGTFIDDGGK
ncbi:MAG TPA: acetyl-CoA carboxylase carboxyltransferase subunit alpha [Thermodesulfobacteriota bacterium]|jgi:acetyl-CoA carboxylase carboxyl transferase subunit alpha|nr:acetyl-CoA carboxylase carboxyltransferase subunit alpha [Thermodesulfobacteriota bacterium]